MPNSGPMAIPNVLQERNPNTATVRSPKTVSIICWADIRTPYSLAEDSSKKAEAKKKSAPSSKDDKGDKPPSAADLSTIHLDGEEDQAVPTTIQPTTSARKSMIIFLAFKGPRAGAHNPAFYAGYVYFEKLRLQQGKKKTAKREKIEDAWKAEGGFPRQGSHNMHLICIQGETWRIDYLGQVQIQGEPTEGAILRKKPRK
ncbi:hypothetical protein LTR37_005255 [Vermiconidia calcicola]|uniref:Uncharacterized protein n=1 Tax=Vermiconidia calcicola TaxID=1690605 RepID=A0ACC3NJV3_9PEZI|nr:hypothetical protein LTR37_005255 [Vermiconidia calcicola]